MRTIASLALFASVALLFAFVNYLQPRISFSRSVVCLDRNTGRILSQRAAFLAPTARKYRSNSYATPTPVTDGKHVVAYYGPGIACMDFSGRVLWKMMEPNYARFVRYGASSSPVIFEDKVIYAFMAELPGGKLGTSEHARHSYLRAVRVDTGTDAWEVRPPGAHDVYDTPLLTWLGEDPMLLFASTGYTVAYDPRNGTDLWSCQVPIEQSVPSIVCDDTTAYVVGGTHGPKASLAIRLNGKRDVTDTHIVWTVTKRIPECSSPVLYHGLLYGITEKGVLTCVDADTGEQVWIQRIRGHYVGSPVAGDGKVYFPADNGEIAVIEAGRKFKLLARNYIGEESASSPAVSAGVLFIRGKDHLFAIGT